MQLFGNQNKQQTWTFPVGPVLPHPQFHRATASVFVAGYGIFIEPVDPATGGMNAWHNLDFQSVEADWDDESGKTEMRVEIAIATGSVHFTLAKLGYSATVLAAIP